VTCAPQQGCGHRPEHSRGSSGQSTVSGICFIGLRRCGRCACVSPHGCPVASCAPARHVVLCDRNRGLDRGGTVRRVSSADREREKEMIKTSSRGRHGSRTRERPDTPVELQSLKHAIRGGARGRVARARHADTPTRDRDTTGHTRRDPTPTGHGTTGSRDAGAGRVGTPHPARRAPRRARSAAPAPPRAAPRPRGSRSRPVTSRRVSGPCATTYNAVASVARDAEPTLARSLLAVVQLPQVEDPFAARGGHSLATR
jgi:hypothetical protein